MSRIKHNFGSIEDGEWEEFSFILDPDDDESAQCSLTSSNASVLGRLILPTPIPMDAHLLGFDVWIRNFRQTSSTFSGTGGLVISFSDGDLQTGYGYGATPGFNGGSRDIHLGAKIENWGFGEIVGAPAPSVAPGSFHGNSWAVNVEAVLASGTQAALAVGSVEVWSCFQRRRSDRVDRAKYGLHFDAASNNHPPRGF